VCSSDLTKLYPIHNKVTMKFTLLTLSTVFAFALAAPAADQLADRQEPLIFYTFKDITCVTLFNLSSIVYQVSLLILILKQRNIPRCILQARPKRRRDSRRPSWRAVLLRIQVVDRLHIQGLIVSCFPFFSALCVSWGGVEVRP